MNNKEALKFAKEQTHIFGGTMKEFMNFVIPLLEERPQGEWIPVCERLPEYTGLYLISIYDLVTVANFTGKHFCDRQMDNFVDVIAWQPLPEPYKEGGAE